MNMLHMNIHINKSVHGSLGDVDPSIFRSSATQNFGKVPRKPPMITVHPAKFKDVYQAGIH